MADRDVRAQVGNNPQRVTPWIGSLLQRLDERWRGTLLIHDGEHQLVAALHFDGGSISRGRMLRKAGGLAESLLLLCSRAEGRVVLAETTDLVGNGPDVLPGPVDAAGLLAAFMRAPLPDDVVDPVFDSIGHDQLKLNPRTDMGRYGFSPHERQVVACLAYAPISLAALRRRAALPERELRRVVYGLLVTRALTQVPATRHAASGQLSHRTPMPGLAAKSRDDEPTRIAPLSYASKYGGAEREPEAAPAERVSQPGTNRPSQARFTLPPSAREPISGRYRLSDNAPEAIQAAHSTPRAQPETTRPWPPPPSAADDAGALFRAAEALLQRGDARNAVFEAQRAMKLRSPKPAEQALYAWLLYQRSGAGAEVPRHVWFHLDQALREDPNCAAALHYKGLLLEMTRGVKSTKQG